jgi:Flp pilus assembly protein TadD
MTIQPRLPLDSLQALARIDSNDAGVHYDLAMGYWSQRRMDDAERSLRTALALEPHNPAVLLALAYRPYACRPYLWIGSLVGQVPSEWRATLDTASQERRLAFLLDPLVDVQIIGVTVPNIFTGIDPHRDAERLIVDLMHAIGHFGNGDYQRVQQDLASYVSDARKLKPPPVTPDMVYWYRALASAHQNQFDAAASDLDTLIQRSVGREAADSMRIPLGRTAELRYFLGLLLLRGNHADRATPLFAQALEGDIGLFPAHSQLARLAEASGDWPKAVLERTRAVDANPGDPVLSMELGVALIKAGRPGEALAPLADAQTGMPRNFRVAYYQGLAALQSGDEATARAAFLRFLDLGPRRVEAQKAEVRKQLATMP